MNVAARECPDLDVVVDGGHWKDNKGERIEKRGRRGSRVRVCRRQAVGQVRGKWQWSERRAVG